MGNKVYGSISLDCTIKLDKVFSGPCEDYLNQLPINYFDVIYCNDVLEHFVDPEMVFTKLKKKLTKKKDHNQFHS
ncbi:methyltransferase domain-containing protein [Nonlabens sp.]|uniref:methyltransferase domain-containing protein n=1 Tax=Nonlabens sp. TaxID=1888209 RepID=UPI003F69D948